MNLMLSGSLGKVLIPKIVKALCVKNGKRIGFWRSENEIFACYLIMKSEEICLNCNAPLQAEDNFCASCGQENKNQLLGVY